MPWSVRFRRLHVRFRPEPQVVPVHVHEDLEILMPISGSWHGAVNGEVLVVPAGGALVVAPGDRHEDRCHQPIGLIGVSLLLLPGPHAGRSASPLAEACPVPSRRVTVAPALHVVANRLAAATAAAGPVTVLRQDALAQELLVELLAVLPAAALTPVVRERIAADGFAAALTAILAANPSGLPVPALARALALSERGLQQRCRRLLGTTPLAAIRRHRLDLARELLATGATVQAVADHLGFANPFHFSTVYRRTFGHPPSVDVRESEGPRMRRTWLRR